MTSRPYLYIVPLILTIVMVLSSGLDVYAETAEAEMETVDYVALTAKSADIVHQEEREIKSSNDKSSAIIKNSEEVICGNYLVFDVVRHIMFCNFRE